MTNDQLMKLAIAAGIVWAAYRFGTPMLKGAAVSIGAVIAAKQIPVLKDYV